MAGNQYMPDPRQLDFLDNFLKKDSETFGNAKQSAIKAGYSEEYAEVITARGNNWLSEVVSRQEKIFKQAEKNLEELLIGEDEKIKADLTKFSLGRLGKEKGYSERIEQTGKDGKDLTPQIIIYGTNDRLSQAVKGTTSSVSVDNKEDNSNK